MMTTLAWLPLVTLALGTATPAAEPARYAVVIGHNGGGEEGRQVLSWADDDAARFYLHALPGLRKAWLLTTFDRESSRAFVDLTDVARPPTKAELARVLGELSWELREAEGAGATPEVTFYFAGHGDVNAGGEGFLVFADGPFTRVDLERQVVGGIPGAIKHVLLDACASYFMVGRGNASGRRALSPEMLDALRGAPAEARLTTGVLVSTSDAAEVHESARVGGGVFSYLLRSALAGGGDSNGDGRVEYVEAAAFIEAASLHIGDERARLEVYARPPQQRPHAPLADLASGGARHFLTVDDARAEHVRVLDARGVPLLEVHRTRDAPVTLALVGAPFFVVQVGGEEALLVPRGAGAYSLSSLRFAPSPASRDAYDPVFAGLYREAFGPSFVAGFASRSEMPPPRPGPPLKVAWAAQGEPPFVVPWTTIGFATLSAGALAAAVAVAATVGNAAAFASLEAEFARTRTVDPALAVSVEAWRTAAVASTATAALLGLVGGGTLAWSLLEEREGVE